MVSIAIFCANVIRKPPLKQKTTMKLMICMVSIVKFCSEFHKALYQGHCDMFHNINDCDIASYADDNTPYVSNSNLDAVINKLEESTNNLFQWFRNNRMKANDTFQLQVTIKSPQAIMNLILKAVKKKNYQVYQLTLYCLQSIILYLFVKMPFKSCMPLQEQLILWTSKNEDP